APWLRHALVGSRSPKKEKVDGPPRRGGSIATLQLGPASPPPGAAHRPPRFIDRLYMVGPLPKMKLSAHAPVPCVAVATEGRGNASTAGIRPIDVAPFVSAQIAAA